MNLTDKCKEEFEEWANNQDWRIEWDLSDFEDMSDSMQYGVYVDFFDAQGIILSINPNGIIRGTCR